MLTELTNGTDDRDDREKVAVIIPVHNKPDELDACLDAVVRAGVGADQVVVVDDASPGEATARVARRHGVHLVRRNRRGGPAAARNAGVAAVHDAQTLFFVDSDVVVAPDVLSRLERALAEPSVGAVFGSYDAAPAVAAPVSRYRNLLHHFVHQEGAEEAWTFWSGCGAVRREAFLAVGGFDENWDWVEDIELGYRLSKVGLKVVYNRKAVSAMVRTLDYDGFCRRSYLQGGSNWVLSDMHRVDVIRAWAEVDGIGDEWRTIEPRYEQIIRVGRDLDRVAVERLRAGLPLDEFTTKLLHRSYYAAFRASRIKGSVDRMQQSVQDAGATESAGAA